MVRGEQIRMDDGTSTPNDKNPNLMKLRSPWFWIVVVLAIGLAVLLGLREGIAIAFAFLSMAIAVFFAMNSLLITRRSLQLTMATSRPFLSVRVRLDKGFRAILTIAVENTGSLPADQVVVDCSWHIQTTDRIEHCSLELEKASQSIIFPADSGESTYLVRSRDNVDKLTHEGSRVKVTVNYQNKLAGQRHTTRRAFCIVFASATPSTDASQAVVIPEEDYWD